VVIAISPSQRRHGDNSEWTNCRRTRHGVVGQNAPPKVPLIWTKSQGTNRDPHQHPLTMFLVVRRLVVIVVDLAARKPRQPTQFK
jgi:hypothetical protein